MGLTGEGKPQSDTAQTQPGTAQTQPKASGPTPSPGESEVTNSDSNSLPPTKNDGRQRVTPSPKDAPSAKATPPPRATPPLGRATPPPGRATPPQGRGMPPQWGHPGYHGNHHVMQSNGYGMPHPQYNMYGPPQMYPPYPGQLHVLYYFCCV